MMQGDPSIAKLVTQQANPAAQQAVGEFNAALQAAGLADQAGSVSQLADQLQTLDAEAQWFISNWLQDRARDIINSITNMVRNYQHCQEGVRLATEVVQAFQRGDYWAVISGSAAAFAAFQRCVG
jgi:hypothetical protein